MTGPPFVRKPLLNRWLRSKVNISRPSYSRTGDVRQTIHHLRNRGTADKDEPTHPHPVSRRRAASLLRSRIQGILALSNFKDVTGIGAHILIAGQLLP